MENTPTTDETLRQHFSRRASSARIAIRKLMRKDRPVPLTDKPATAAAAIEHFDERSHR